MIYQTDKPPMNDRRYQACFEFMFVLSKGTVKTFNPIKRKSRKAGTKRIGTTYREMNNSLKDQWRGGVVAKETILENIWYYPTGGVNVGHPAAFPEQLAADHIESWSNPGDVVLDCFCGSGTTPKMAKVLSRHYIGIEISQEYISLAEKRLLATNVPLFGLVRGLTLPAPDGGDSAPSQALSTPDMFSAIEHEPTLTPAGKAYRWAALAQRSQGEKMDCVKCGSPMYHPSPNKLCPQCEGERLDKWIAEQETAQQKMHPTFGESAASDSESKPAPKRVI
jgi:hypothetical protein